MADTPQWQRDMMDPISPSFLLQTKRSGNPWMASALTSPAAASTKAGPTGSWQLASLF